MRNYLILLIILIHFGCSPNDNSKVQKYDSYSAYKDRSSRISWKSPEGDEFLNYGKILVKNNVSGCGEYYIGKYKGETKIACTNDGKSFKYYDVWESIEKVNGTPKELSKVFNSPY